MSDDHDRWGTWPSPPPEARPAPPPTPALAASRAAPPAPRALAARLDRRTLLAGTGVAVLLTGGVAASQLFGDDEPTPPAIPDAAGGARAGTPPTRPSPAAPAAATPAATLEASPAEAATAPEVSSPVAGGAGLPGDAVVVVSPRLPLYGIGQGDVEALLAGTERDWRALGLPYALPVEPIALANAAAGPVAPVATVPDYEGLVAALDERSGGVAVAPRSAVDFRVNVLSVGTDDPWRAADPGAEPLVRIAVVGDIVPGRNVHFKMVEYGDFLRPFRAVAPHLAAYDLTIANLEGNLSATLPQPAETDPNSFSFVSDPAMIEGFKLAGIDAVSLANNHSVWNEDEVGWGVQGLLDTLDALGAAGMPHFGAGRSLAEARAPWTTTVNGLRIAVLGVDGVTANYEVEPGVANGVVDYDAGAGAESPGTNPWVSTQFLEDIAAAASAADVVIPYFHGGVEYVNVPPRWLVEGARAAIDAGANLVVTNHPHVIGGLEVHNGRPIVYSPGNFVFDQMFSVEVRSGFILDLTLRGDRVVALRCHGVEIQDFHQPRLMTAGEHAGLMDRFWSATDRLAAGEFG